MFFLVYLLFTRVACCDMSHLQPTQLVAWLMQIFVSCCEVPMLFQKVKAFSGYILHEHHFFCFSFQYPNFCLGVSMLWTCWYILVAFMHFTLKTDLYNLWDINKIIFESFISMTIFNSHCPMRLIWTRSYHFVWNHAIKVGYGYFQVNETNEFGILSVWANLPDV